MASSTTPILLCVLVLLARGMAIDDAVSRSCKSMDPGYNTPPEARKMPFIITTKKTTYRPDEIIEVVINATSRTPLKGFLIQARRVDPRLDRTVPIGYFITQEGTSPECTITTADSYGNALTHVAGSNREWNSLTLRWNAPSRPMGHLQFWATIIADYDMYWVAETSAIVYDPTAPALPTTTTPKYEPDSIFSPMDLRECGTTKSCYRNPPGCKSEACDVIVSWRLRDRDWVEIEMQAFTNHFQNFLHNFLAHGPTRVWHDQELLPQSAGLQDTSLTRFSRAMDLRECGTTKSCKSGACDVIVSWRLRDRDWVEIEMQYVPDSIFSAMDLRECGTTKSCYRNPPGCKSEACDVIVSWRLRDRDWVEIEMQAFTEGWVAIGFSDDKKMGNDDVFECVMNNDQVEVRNSWNTNDGKDNEVLNQHGIRDVETSRDEYRIRCRFLKDRNAAGVYTPFKGEYHILAAKGPATKEGVKKRHDLEPGKHPYVSKKKYSLSDNVDIDGTARYWLVKFHGILMVIAWMMCCMTALLVAKYYKPMWPNQELCGTDVWFAVHRGCQCVTLCCTVLGFILIFIHAGGYSQMPELPDKAHPILGIIVTVLCIINPLLALCRCNPKSDKRPIFNWIHWFFGTIAAVLAMPTLFIGLNLHKAFVPWWLSWVLGAFMLFHLVVELMLEIHGCINGKRQKERDEEYEHRRKGDYRGDYRSLRPEPVGTRFKKRTLAIYLCVLIICGLIAIFAIAFG